MEVLEMPPDQEIHSVHHDDLTTPDVGTVVGIGGDSISSTSEEPKGILVDEVPSDNPPEMRDVYGNGALLDLEGALSSAQSVGTEIFSDGNGGFQTSEPTADAWRVGYIDGDEDGGNSKVLRVSIMKVEA